MKIYDLRTTIVSILLAIVSFSTADAQHPSWMQFSCGKEIRAIAADSAALWVGTNAGVVRISRRDGQRQFFTNATAALPRNEIEALAAGFGGEVWIAAAGTLLRLKGDSWQQLNLPVSGHVTNMAVARNGVVWIGTESNGCAVWNGSAWKLFDATITGSGCITAIAIDADNTTWIGTQSSELNGTAGGASRGLLKYNDTGWSSFSVANSGIGSNEISALAVDGASIWVAHPLPDDDRLDPSRSTPILLSRFDGKQWTTFRHPDFQIVQICALGGDSLALGTWNAGVVHFNGADWSAELPDAATRSIGVLHADRLGVNGKKFGGSGGCRLIAGTPEGLFSKTGGSWKFCETSNGPFTKRFFPSIVCDRSTTIWTVNNNAAAFFDGSLWKAVPIPDVGLPIVTMTIDGRNRLWALLYDPSAGLFQCSGGRWQRFSLDLTAPIDAMAADHHGNLLLGCKDEVILRDTAGATSVIYSVPTHASEVHESGETNVAQKTGRHIHVPAQTAMPADQQETAEFGRAVGASTAMITDIAVDSRNDYWICTGSAWLQKYSAGKLTTFDTTNSSLPSAKITSICFDDASSVAWIGTGTKLVRFDGTSWQLFTPPPAQPPEPISDIRVLTVDPSHAVWIRTYERVLRFDGSRWQEYTTKSSGLPSVGCNAACVDSTGAVWFATDNGLGRLAASPTTIKKSTVATSQSIDARAVFRNGSLRYSIAALRDPGRVTLTAPNGRLLFARTLESARLVQQEVSLQPARGVYLFTVTTNRSSVSRVVVNAGF